jgi:chromosomal replication initiation ATPase DnaA
MELIEKEPDELGRISRLLGYVESELRFITGKAIRVIVHESSGTEVSERDIFESVNIIIDTVCMVHGLERVIIFDGRKSERVDARRQMHYLMREKLGMSLTAVGIQMNGVDHSTVIHNLAVHGDLMDTDSIYRNRFLEVCRILDSKYSMGNVITYGKAKVDAELNRKRVGSSGQLSLIQS